MKSSCGLFWGQHFRVLEQNYEPGSSSENTGRGTKFLKKFPVLVVESGLVPRTTIPIVC